MRSSVQSTGLATRPRTRPGGVVVVDCFNYEKRALFDLELELQNLIFLEVKKTRRKREKEHAENSA